MQKAQTHPRLPHTKPRQKIRPPQSVNNEHVHGGTMESKNLWQEQLAIYKPNCTPEDGQLGPDMERI
jgi:hypothetical protein